ncbi:hypothetical protein K437DRAFT_220368 [Tilletiaria anomala UBC 951]|uniref:sn-1-specific diacylglycerol lipase n=1 Tax=Tilletiaria anomala (strain ATCC 24038 / CBS 436.72 / UBC 951) TaxID=1037660 RepID=A0A066WPS1_TILAU|nr:uncharacterized protein K437DRAFT_220368 [Tilletiaria anomala UBC 951]KDN52625.1 hypothetical protein K437DRAFT_220368 [Tilletiaria anomala UBC 951]
MGTPASSSGGLVQVKPASRHERRCQDDPPRDAEDTPLVRSSAIQNADQLDWPEYFTLAQQTLNVANAAQSVGFNIAKGATAASLRVARFFTKHVLALPALAIDVAVGTPPDSPGMHLAATAGVDGVFNIVDAITLGSLDVGCAVTAASLSAVSTGVECVSSTMHSDVSRSLSTFGRLFSREWNRTSDELPPGGLPVYERLTIACAILCWVSLQAVTAEDFERDMLEHLSLVADDEELQSLIAAPGSDAHEVSSARPRVRHLVQHSRLILAIYGGVIMALLNSVPSNFAKRTQSQDAEAARIPVDIIDQPSAITQFELENPQPSIQLQRLQGTQEQLRRADKAHTSAAAGRQSKYALDNFSYIDLLTGKYDHYLLHEAAGVTHSQAVRGSYDQSVHSAQELNGRVNKSRPNYYVITSHEARKIIVVMRGTVTLGDVATDLACESQSLDGIISGIPAASRVHAGILVTALAIGRQGRAVHRAVREAAIRSPDYDLDLVGHSLGAGVMALLCLLWGSPATGRTREDSALGPRNIHAYCYAAPCVMDAQLGLHCNRIITSFISSWDLVSRLSLGSITDIRNVIAWLCYWENSPDEDFTCAGFIGSTLEHQSGRMDSSTSVRQRFEDKAKYLMQRVKPCMTGVHLYPPGKIFISYRNTDLRTTQGGRSPLLFEVTGDRARVFDRIVFGSGMLYDHLPQVYVETLAQLNVNEAPRV